MECADYHFITNANKHENSTLKDMHLTSGNIAVFDMGYFNKKTFLNFTNFAISFVTRNKAEPEGKKISGQSDNAVKTQIWIALIVHFLFLILKAENTETDWTFSSFCSEIGGVLFKHRDLNKWFARDYAPLQSLCRIKMSYGSLIVWQVNWTGVL